LIFSPFWNNLDKKDKKEFIQKIIASMEIKMNLSTRQSSNMGQGPNPFFKKYISEMRLMEIIKTFLL